MSRSRESEARAPAPNEVSELHGHADAEAALIAAYRSRRLHHALMLCGPPGIGKATLAYRFARFLLAHPVPDSPEARGAESLTVPPDARVSRLVARGAHPDLVVLTADMFQEENRSGEIKVEHVRWAQRKLATASDSGGWRICIVDTVDDLNRNAANALLKGLEEPSANTLFLLIANRPGRLLPTIRSRCLRLDLAPLADAEFRAAIAGAAPEIGAPEIETLARLANGSPGAAIAMASAGGLELARSLEGFTSALPGIDLLALHAFADSLAGPRAGDRFDLFMTLFLDWLAGSVRARAAAGEASCRLEPWVQLWDKVVRAFEDTRALNLDRKQLILATFFDLESAARASAPR